MGNYVSIKSEPQIYTVVYYDDATFSPERETNVIIASENAVLTLGNSAPYEGFSIPVSAHVAWDEWVYIIAPFGNSTYCIALSYMDRVRFGFYNGNWILEDGSELALTSTAVTNAPSGYLANDWRTNISTSNMSFVYFGVNTTTYNLPYSNVSISVKRWGANGFAQAIETSESEDPPRQWVNRMTNSVWENTWTEIVMPSSEQTLVDKTIDFKDNTILDTTEWFTADTTLTSADIARKRSLGINSNNKTLTVGNVTAPYIGYVLPIMARTSSYVRFNSVWNNDTILFLKAAQSINLKYGNTHEWVLLDEGACFYLTSQTKVDNIFVNDWRKIPGFGTFTFFYNYTGASTDYELPDDNCCVEVTWMSWNSPTMAKAVATKLTNGTKKTWIKSYQSVSGSNVWDSTWTELADDSDVVHISGDGTTPEVITGVKEFIYGHSAAQDDNNPSVRAARLRITGQVAPSASQKTVSQVDFYIGDESVGYMGVTRQNNKTFLKVASQGQTTPLIFGYLPYSDNTSCIRFEKDKPVWRGGQTGTYSADKALAVVGDIKSGTYTLTNKTIDAKDNTIKTTPTAYSSTPGSALAPTGNVNYSITAANVNIPIGNGAFDNQTITVIAKANGSISYKGSSLSTTTQTLSNGRKATLTWNGSYWICTITATIEGIDASGNAFSYDGETSIISSSSSNTQTVTTNSSTLNPANYDKFIMNVNVSGAVAQLSNASETFKEIEIMNINDNVISVSYTSLEGTTTDIIPKGVSKTFRWFGSYYSTDLASPYIIASTTSITPRKKMDFVVNTANITFTLNAGPYPGYTTTISAFADFYLSYTNSTGNVTNHVYNKQKITMTWGGSYWVFEREGVGKQNYFSLGGTGTGSDNPLRYVMAGNICYVYLRGVTSSDTTLNTWHRVSGPIPRMLTGVTLTTASGNQVSIADNGTESYIQIYKANSNPVYGYFCYPTNGLWIEP